MRYQGVQGSIELLEDFLVISRKGLGAALSHGLKGDKRIPYSSISAVQLKKAGLTRGYIQFTIIGGNESRGGVFAAASDENTVLFTSAQQAGMLDVQAEVERRLIASRRPVAAAPTAPVPAPAPVSVAEELGKLGDLRDRGVLTEEEFTLMKRKLLS